MPYKISERDGKFHVHKEGSEESLGTHDSREEAENQVKAIEANEHTDPPPANDPPPPPPAHDDLRDTVHELSEKVSLLETTVQGLLPENRDESPVKKPWTHRGFGEKR